MGIAERKEREKKQRREEIVRAAELVFFAKGFDSSTMDDVAEKAELSKGTLYLYFTSKEELYFAVARNAIHLLRKHTSQAVEGEGNAIEKLGRMGGACIDFSQTYPDQMKAIMTMEEMEPLAMNISESGVQEMIFQESTVGSVIQLVEQGVQEKLIRDDIPSLLVAHTLWMTVLSVIRFVTLRPGLMQVLGLSQEQLLASHFQLVLNGIRS
jgi:AcrR family transcriptional regulator